LETPMSNEPSQPSVGTNFESLLRENRVFPPPPEFAAKAHISSEQQYEAMYRRSVEEPEAFWAEAAGELEWFSKWTSVLDGEGAHAKWFSGGKLNLCHNCVDRHAAGARKDKVALLWEGEPG
jgi:acetyl-CoA synthetase